MASTVESSPCDTKHVKLFFLTDTGVGCRLCRPYNEEHPMRRGNSSGECEPEVLSHLAKGVAEVWSKSNTRQHQNKLHHIISTFHMFGVQPKIIMGDSPKTYLILRTQHQTTGGWHCAAPGNEFQAEGLSAFPRQPRPTKLIITKNYNVALHLARSNHGSLSCPHL